MKTYRLELYEITSAVSQVHKQIHLWECIEKFMRAHIKPTSPPYIYIEYIRMMDNNAQIRQPRTGVVSLSPASKRNTTHHLASAITILLQKMCPSNQRKHKSKCNHPIIKLYRKPTLASSSALNNTSRCILKFLSYISPVPYCGLSNIWVYIAT